MAKGLLGLSQNVRSTESSLRDISVLERMDQRVEADRNAEAQADMQHAQLMETMYAKADQYLGKDRQAINKRISMFQEQMSTKIDMYGGSKKDFYRNGGASFVTKLGGDIMRSPEAIQFEENKKNLAKIFELQEKKMGHLISPKDLQSVEAYEKNPNGGAIQYSGVMAEVETPPSDLFDYGTDIPMDKLLSYNGNMIKVKANYAMVYPDMPDPSPERLAAFAKEMGYGGMGSNTTRMKEQAAMIKAASKAKQATTKAEKDKRVSFLGQYNVLADQFPKDLDMTKYHLPVEEGGYGGSVIEQLRKENEGINRLLGDEMTERSTGMVMDKAGFDIHDIVPDATGDFIGKNLNQKIALRDAYEILPHNKFQIAKRVFDAENAGYEIKNGKLINFFPPEGTFRNDGMKLSGSRKLNPDEHTGDYDIVSVNTALRSKSADVNEEILLVDYYKNWTGDRDEDKSKTLDETYTSNPELATVVTIKDKNGALFYFPVDVTKPQIQQVLSESMGADNDLTEVVAEDKDASKKIAQIYQNTTEEQIKFQDAIVGMEETVFNDEVFKMQGEKYYMPNSAGQVNRNNLRKSFYMAFDFAANSLNRSEEYPNGDRNIYSDTMKSWIDNNAFETVVDNEKDENNPLPGLLRDYSKKIPDEQLVNMWLVNANEDLEPGSLGIKKNTLIASKWLQTLKIMQ